jgi:putative sigma-54 modulation protein
VQIKISTRHGHLADSTQQFIQDKAEKLLHLFSRLTMIEVTVDLQDGLTVVEFIAKSEHKHDFVASEANKDVLTAVDLVMAKLEGQLRKHKEKLQDHRRTPHAGEGVGAPAPEERPDE